MTYSEIIREVEGLVRNGEIVKAAKAMVDEFSNPSNYCYILDQANIDNTDRDAIWSAIVELKN